MNEADHVTVLQPEQIQLLIDRRPGGGGGGILDPCLGIGVPPRV